MLILCLTCVSAKASEEVLSSGFQTPDVPNHSAAVQAAGSVVDGWKLLFHDATLIDGTTSNRALPALSAGRQFLELGRDFADAAIERTVSLTSTGTVTLRLQLAGNLYTATAQRRGNVTVTWSLAGVTTNQVAFSQQNLGFQGKSADFPVTRVGRYTLRIQNVSGTDASIDDVVLTADLAVVAPMVDVRLVPGILVSGLPGASYQVQYAEALLPETWLPLTTITLQGSSLMVADPGGVQPGGQRFYRAVQVP